MLRVVTWCAKCLFIYLLVAIAAIRFSWIFATPIWQLATRMQWTHLTRLAYLLSYFLPIFAATGFVIGLIPFGKLGKALGDLFRSLVPSATQLAPERDLAPPILWAWLPVTLAFLIRFATWQSRNSSVFDPHRSVGRVERFFGPLYGQAPGLLDDKWITDRFIFTGPMLFLIACALAVLLRHRLTTPRKPQVETNAGGESV
jgi:hypothetical protein